MWEGLGPEAQANRVSLKENEKAEGELAEDELGATEGSRKGMLWRELILGTGLWVGGRSHSWWEVVGREQGGMCHTGTKRIQALRGRRGTGSGFLSQVRGLEVGRGCALGSARLTRTEPVGTPGDAT